MENGTTERLEKIIRELNDVEKKKYAILQPAEGIDEAEDYRFTEKLADGNLYEMVYFNTLSDNESNTINPEDIIMEFNSDKPHPSDYYGTSPSMGDIILISPDGIDINAYKINQFGTSDAPDILNDKIKIRFDKGLDIRKELILLEHQEDKKDLEERMNYIDEEYSPIFAMADKRSGITHSEEEHYIFKEIKAKDSVFLNGKSITGNENFIVLEHAYSENAASNYYRIAAKEDYDKTFSVGKSFEGLGFHITEQEFKENFEVVENIGEKSLEQLYYEAMKIAGYEMVETESGSLATVTFGKIGTDKKIGFDGWELVGDFLESESELMEGTQKENIRNLIYPKGRVQYYTLNLGGTGINEDKEPILYNEFSNAVNDYLGSGADGKSMGVMMNGEYTQLADFDMVTYKNNYLTDSSNLSENFAVNELRELQTNMQTLKKELDRDNAYKALEYNFSGLVTASSADMIRQNSERGFWSGRIANDRRPQDYINIDITGYDTHHKLSCEVSIVHANEVVDVKSFIARTNVNNFEEKEVESIAISFTANNFENNIKNATKQVCEEFKDYLKDAVEKLDTDMEHPFTVYSSILGEELEEHYTKLNDAGYEENPSYVNLQQPIHGTDNQEFDKNESSTAVEQNIQTDEPKNKSDTAAEKDTQTDEPKTIKEQVMKELVDGIKRTLDSKEFAAWCQKQGKLFYNNYSFQNAMLTYLQKPEATYVCGYEKWKDFGRQVNKGAKGIKILAPAFAKEYNGKGSLYGAIKKQCTEQFKKNPDLEYSSYQLGKSNLSFLMYKNEQGIGKNPLYDIRVGDKVVMAHATENEVRKFIDLNVIGKVPVYYNAVTVFDISDTSNNVEHLWVGKESAKKYEIVLDDNGQPITNKKGQVKIINTPERKARFSGGIEMNLAEQDPGKMQALYECLQKISENKGIPISEASKSADKTLAGGALGYYRLPTEGHPKGNIVIDRDLPLTDKVAVTFHEMAHSDLHMDLEQLRDDMSLGADEKISRQMKEMQAEAVAYMTASTFGIETEHKSFEYIANWSNGRELKELEKSLNVIYKESQSLLKAIEKELDNRGLTMTFEAKDKTPLTEAQKEPFVKEIKTFVLNNMRSNENLQKSAFAEMKSAELEQEKSILKEQVLISKKIEEKLGDLNSKIEQYAKVVTKDEQTTAEVQIKASMSQIMTLQGRVEELSEERISVVHEQSKEDLRQMYYADPVKALKQMRKDIPQMNGLSDTDIKLIAKSSYIEKNYTELLGRNNEQFAENAMKQLDNIKSAMSKNGCVVEICFCEQWTPKPFFEAGTVAHPKEANRIFADAEKQVRELKNEAEKEGEYFPYTKCEVNILSVSDKNKVTSLKERVDIGDGTQKDLKDALEQSCPKSQLCQQFMASTRERSNIQLLTPVWEKEEHIETETVKNEVPSLLERDGDSMPMEGWKNQLDRENNYADGKDTVPDINRETVEKE